MSVPVRFDWYDVYGTLLMENRGCFTINYTDNSGDLNLLGRRLAERSVTDHQRFVHPNVKYVVPHSAPDYMFDLEDPLAILPNRFKK